jgi:hypothetical protein
MSGGDFLTLDEGRAAVRYCNSYTRLEVLHDLAWRMDPGEWLTVLGEEWEVCDNIAVYRDVLVYGTPFAALVHCPREWRHYMMTDDEREALAALPDTMTIFRGCYFHNRHGLSWSLDSTVAEQFPRLWRYQHHTTPLLIEAEIERDQILALKMDRGESEIIAWRPRFRSVSRIERQVTA